THLGERRWAEGEARQRLAGTDTLYQLTILRRAVQQRDMRLQHQAGVIRALHAILNAANAHPAQPAVAPPNPRSEEHHATGLAQEIAATLRVIRETLEVQP